METIADDIQVTLEEFVLTDEELTYFGFPRNISLSSDYNTVMFYYHPSRDALHYEELSDDEESSSSSSSESYYSDGSSFGDEEEQEVNVEFDDTDDSANGSIVEESQEEEEDDGDENDNISRISIDSGYKYYIPLPVLSSTDKVYEVDYVNNLPTIYDGIHRCVRCYEYFYIGNGQYFANTACCEHQGYVYVDGDDPHCSCLEDNGPCIHYEYHVWNGYEIGRNFINDSCVITIGADDESKKYGVYSIYGEMCHTIAGLEITRVSLANMDNTIIYDCLIEIQHKVLDWNWRKTSNTQIKKGIAMKSLQDVQMDLLQLIHSDTILIGCNLEYLFRGLRLVHSRVIDMSRLLPEHSRCTCKNAVDTMQLTNRLLIESCLIMEQKAVLQLY